MVLGKKLIFSLKKNFKEAKNINLEDEFLLLMSHFTQYIKTPSNSIVDKQKEKEDVPRGKGKEEEENESIEKPPSKEKKTKNDPLIHEAHEYFLVEYKKRVTEREKTKKSKPTKKEVYEFVVTQTKFETVNIKSLQSHHTRYLTKERKKVQDQQGERNYPYLIRISDSESPLTKNPKKENNSF